MPDDVNEIGADERVVEIEMERLREFRNGCIMKEAPASY